MNWMICKLSFRDCIDAIKTATMTKFHVSTETSLIALDCSIDVTLHIAIISDLVEISRNRYAYYEKEVHISLCHSTMNQQGESYNIIKERNMHVTRLALGKFVELDKFPAVSWTNESVPDPNRKIKTQTQMEILIKYVWMQLRRRNTMWPYSGYYVLNKN